MRRHRGPQLKTPASTDRSFPWRASSAVMVIPASAGLWDPRTIPRKRKTVPGSYWSQTSEYLPAGRDPIPPAAHLATHSAPARRQAAPRSHPTPAAVAVMSTHGHRRSSAHARGRDPRVAARVRARRRGGLGLATCFRALARKTRETGPHRLAMRSSAVMSDLHRLRSKDSSRWVSSALARGNG
jgi:hypothetical protein